MKISCNVIRDLLPLYAEELASADSRAVVEAHLETCDACRAAVRSMKKPVEVRVEDAGAMESVRREILRRRWLAMGCAVLLVCAMGCWALNWLTSPIYLDESVITAVQPGEQGTVTIRMDAAAAGRNTFQFELETTPDRETLIAWTSRWLELGWTEPAPRNLEITRSVTGYGVYYFPGREGEEDLLIYENPKKYVDGGVMTLPRLVLNYYFLLALVLGGAALAAAALLRKCRAGKTLAGLGTLLWSYALCQGIVCGFSFSSYFALREFAWAVAMTLCAWGAGLCGWKLLKK